MDHVSNIQSCQPSFFPPCSVLSSLPLLLLLYSFIFHSQRRGVPCYHDRRYMRRAKQSISHLYILFFKSLGTYFCKETKKQPFKQTNKCKRCKLGLMLLSVHVFYNKGVYFILLYRQECFTGKYTARKIHTKLHLGPEWRIFHILTSEDIDGVISRSFTSVCPNSR